MNRLKNLHHTTCRNRILEEKTTGKRVKIKMWMRTMEREGYCELIWCSNVTWFLGWSLIQNHFPNKMHMRGIVWVLKCNIIFKIIFHTKCTRWLLNRCLNVICFFSWSLNQNHFPHKIHFPHKMHKRKIYLFVCFVSSSLIQNHIIFHTKCTGGGGWDQPAGVLHKN